jgi:hypothetical protein
LRDSSFIFLSSVVYPAATGPGNRLVGRDDDLYEAKLAGHRSKRDDHLDRGAVRVGDDALVVREGLGVHLGYHERHLRI